jgi:O-antigen ligase
LYYDKLPLSLSILGITLLGVTFVFPRILIFYSVAFFFVFFLNCTTGIISFFPIDLFFPLATIAGSLFIIKDRQKEHLLPESKTLFFIYFIFFLICLFSFFTNLPQFEDLHLTTSIWYLYRCLQLLIVILLVSFIKIPNKVIEFVFDAFIFMALLQFPVAMQQLTSGDAVTGTLTNHHAYLACILIIPFFLSIYKGITAYLSKSHIIKTIYYFSASLCIIYLIFASGCRSALVGLLLSMAIYFLLFFLKKGIKVVIISLTLFALFFFLFYHFTPLGKMIESTINSNQTPLKIDISSLSRLIIWKYTWINFLNFPIFTKLFGIGIGTFSFMKVNFILWDGSHTFGGAHFNLLHVLIETGIIGLLIFLTLFVYKIGFFLKHKKHFIAQAGLLITLSLLFSGISQETIWFQNSLGVLWMTYLFIILLIMKKIAQFKTK